MRFPTTKTAPTAGFGLVCPTAFRASDSALRMNRSSLLIWRKQIFGATEHEQIFLGNTGAASAGPKADVIRDRSSKQRAFLLGESVAADLLRVNPQKFGSRNSADRKRLR